MLKRSDVRIQAINDPDYNGTLLRGEACCSAGTIVPQAETEYAKFDTIHVAEEELKTRILRHIYGEILDAAIDVEHDIMRRVGSLDISPMSIEFVRKKLHDLIVLIASPMGDGK